MGVTIDCRLLEASGVGVYLRGVLPWLLDSGGRFLLLGSAEKLRCFDRPGVEIIECAIKPFSLRELLFFPPSLAKKINKTSAYFAPYFNIPSSLTIPVYTTIHDIIFPDMPRLTSKAGLAARMWFYRRAFRRSKKIFTVSEFSASRIRHYARDKVPVVVTHSAIQDYFLAPLPPVQKKNTVIFVGNIKWHKGLWCLTEAFSSLKKEGLPYTLVIVGEKDNFRSKDTTLPENLHDGENGIEFTGHIPDEKLRLLIAESALLVQPSLYEGFCLPPLEALVSGTRALVSDIPVLREIYAEYPVTFFRAGDSADLARTMSRLLREREAPVVRLPLELKTKYTFEKTARKIMENW
jgi:glycosyltransferase involved in cell wall biosynthesis